MFKSRLILILGTWLAVLPYLGFPSSWRNVLTTLSGLGFMYISFMLYQEFKKKEAKEEKVFDNFSENEFEADEQI